MEIKIRQEDTKQIYTSNMSDENKHTIISIHFCTSYTQVEVQDEKDGKFSTHDIILPPLGTESNWIDSIAIEGDPTGEWVKQTESQ